MKLPPVLLPLLLTLCPSLSAYDTLPDRNPLPNISEVQEVVGLWAETDEGAPSITLRFLYADDYEVYRRVYGEDTWGTALTASTGEDSENWTDTSVSTGVIYEYAVKKVGVEDYGYITAGINVDEAGPRGTLILVIAENIIAGNEARLQTLLEDLVGDGWKVRTILTPVFTNNAFNWDNNSSNGLYSFDYARELRNQIRGIYNEEPDAKMLYFLGHTPTAQSGLSVVHPDGHGSRSSYVTDFFYADMDGIWTDSNNSVANPGTGGELSLPNIPGDGIYDPSTMPSTLELAFGRVDPFQSGNSNSVHGEDHGVTLAKYLDKAHKYKHYEPYGQAGSETLIGRKGIIRHKSGGQNGATALGSQFLAIFGLDNMEDYHGNSGDYDYLVNNGPYLFYGQNSQGPTGLAPGEKGAHRFGMQSWWGDWFANESSRNNLFGDENMTMTWLYSGRWDTQYHLFPLGIGKTFGEALLLSQNYEWEEYFTGNPGTANYYERREFLRNLVGDPTLRMFPVPPPQSLTATPNGADVDLAWSAPVDLTEFVEYRIYRASSLMGDFTQIATGLTSTSFTDTTAPTGSKVYMVQAVHDIATGSGNFLNNSQGVFASIGLTMDQLILPPFPLGEDVDYDLTVSGANGSAVWSIAQGQLPPGLELLSSGKIQGNPVTPGQYRITLEVVDNDATPIQQEFSILVDGEMTEIVNLDLRGDGLGVADKTQFQRLFTVWGNPVTQADGTVFDGNGDAIQVHHMAEGNSTFPDYEELPHGNGKNWSMVMSFKADPSSTGGILISRAYNLDGAWSANKTNYVVLMNASGQIQGRITTRKTTSTASYNDGDWHQLVFKGNGDLYVDNVFIGSMSPASKTVSHDALIGARWADENGNTLADEFTGMIRDVKIYRSYISEGEVSALYDRFTGDRSDISPNPPVITGLPNTYVINEGDDVYEMRIPFNMSDPDGEPVKAVMIPSDLELFQHYEIAKTATGYELIVSLDHLDKSPANIIIAAEDGWPGHTDVHTVQFVYSGGTQDVFQLGIGSSLLDVLANDVTLPGETMTLSGLGSEPSAGYVTFEDGKIAFYPPTDWSEPLSFTYNLLFSPSGEERSVLVTVEPENPPVANDDSADMTGSGTIQIDVLANDYDPLGESITIARIEQPARGYARIVGGQIEYTPATGIERQIDSFTYHVRNETGFSDKATVTINRTDITISGPLVELLLDEASGSAAANSGSLGVVADGTINGTTSWPSGVSGSALTFDGSTNYVDLGNASALSFNPAQDSFSVTVAVKPDASLTFNGSERYTILSKQNDSGDTQFTLSIGKNPGDNYASVLAQFKGQSINAYEEPANAYTYYERCLYWRYIDVDGNYNDADWRLITLINDAELKELRIYVDDWLVALLDTSSMDFDQTDTGSNWLIGARPDGASGQTDYFHGDIDNLTIYDRAIDPLEISPQLQAMGFPANLAPVILPGNFTPTVPSQSAEYTFQHNKLYRFEPLYEDLDTPEDDIDIQWRVYDPEFNLTYYDATELDLTFSQQGQWRLYYNIKDPDHQSRIVNTGYIYVTVSGSENLPDNTSIQITSPKVIAVNANEAVSATITATGGTLPYNFTLVDGSLPAGLTFNSNGTITGTTATEGRFNLLYIATDSSGLKVIQAAQIVVGPEDTDADKLPDDWEATTFGGQGFGPNDKDSFGIPALVRYALGADSGMPSGFPLTMQNTRGPVDNGDDFYYIIRYQQRSEMAGIATTVKCSTNLVSWMPVDADPVIVNDDGAIQTLELRVPRAGDAQKFFIIDVQ